MSRSFGGWNEHKPSARLEVKEVHLSTQNLFGHRSFDKLAGSHGVTLPRSHERPRSCKLIIATGQRIMVFVILGFNITQQLLMDEILFHPFLLPFINIISGRAGGGVLDVFVGYGLLDG